MYTLPFYIFELRAEGETVKPEQIHIAQMIHTGTNESPAYADTFLQVLEDLISPAFYEYILGTLKREERHSWK